MSDDDRIDFSALATGPRELERLTQNIVRRAMEPGPYPLAHALLGWRTWVLVGATAMAAAAWVPAWLTPPEAVDSLALEDSP